MQSAAEKRSPSYFFVDLSETAQNFKTKIYKFIHRSHWRLYAKYSFTDFKCNKVTKFLSYPPRPESRRR